MPIALLRAPGSPALAGNDTQCRRGGLDFRLPPHAWAATTLARGGDPNHIQPAAERACIAKHVTWHCFRHSFSTLLVDNKQRREDGAAHDASRQQSRHSGTVYGSDRRKNPEGARPDRRAGAHRARPGNAGGWKCLGKRRIERRCVPYCVP